MAECEKQLFDKKQLHQENQQLKKTVNQQKHEISRLIDICNNLKIENEGLKQTMKEVAELLSNEVDVFSDKAIEHDINAYVELIELDNKDAYYMAKATKIAIKLLKGDVE